LVGVGSSSSRDNFEEYLQEFCERLRRLRREAGGPKVDTLARDPAIALRKTQIYAILNGEIKEPPSFDLVQRLVRLAHEAARGRSLAVSTDMVVWRRDHARLVLLAETSRRQRPPAGPVPHELPPDVSHFTGRVDDLRRLDDLVAGAAGRAPTVVITAIAGTAGVGKTALAVYWSHRAASRFPDGELYVDLRGYDSQEPIPAAEVLARFLRALGVDGADVPSDLDERSNRFRTLVSHRSMLIVLDNASRVDQVRPLLPGTGSCVVIVTSRDSLSGLVVRDGATRVDLDALDLDEAIDLLRSVLGPKVDADLDGSALLAGRCARLPLALRIAAEFASLRATLSLGDLAADLEDERRRLAVLDTGDDSRTAIRATFSWSYRHLRADASRLFRLLGLHPGHDIGPAAIGALADIDPDEARRLVEILNAAHLIRTDSAGRTSTHDLLRIYAQERARADEPEPARQAAIERLLEYYLTQAGAAMDGLYPAERTQRPPTDLPPDESTPTEAESAAAWLEAERHNLVAATGFAANAGWPHHAIRLGSTFWRHLDTTAHHGDSMTTHGYTLHAARAVNDREAEASVLTDLGMVTFRLGRLDEAIDHLRLAVALSDELGGLARAGSGLNVLGLIHERLGRLDEAERYLRRSLAISRRVREPRSEGNALHNLGSAIAHRPSGQAEALTLMTQALTIYRQIGEQVGAGRTQHAIGAIHARLGQYAEAERDLRSALDVLTNVGDRNGLAGTLDDLGDLFSQQGRFDEAEHHLRRGSEMFREVDDPFGVANTLSKLGVVCRHCGRLDEARELLDHAVDVAQERGFRPVEASALNGLGELDLVEGRVEDALTNFRAALELSAQTGEQYEEVRAYEGIGGAFAALGNDAKARESWQLALRGYDGQSLPATTRLRGRLLDL
jgi:tetratricopeptide (TPR) repeat protein